MADDHIALDVSSDESNEEEEDDNVDIDADLDLDDNDGDAEDGDGLQLREISNGALMMLDEERERPNKRPRIDDNYTNKIGTNQKAAGTGTTAVRRFVSKPEFAYLRLRLTYPSPPQLPTTAFFKKHLSQAIQSSMGLLNGGADLDVLSLTQLPPPSSATPVTPPSFESFIRVRPEALTGIHAALTLLTKIEGREVRVDVVEKSGWLVSMGGNVDSRTWVP